MLQGKKVEISTGGNFDPVPMDRYTVQIVDVDLVTQNKFQSSEEEEVLNYKFAILDDKPMEITNKSGEKEQASTRGRYLWKRCRLAINDRSWLGKLAKAVAGRSLTKEEAAAFDPESVVGKQVDVMVEQVAKDEKVYANIVSFGKTAKPLTEMAESELKPAGKVVEKTTSPAIAPDADAEADSLISQVKSEQEAPADDVAELEAKLKAAKEKAAKAVK